MQPKIYKKKAIKFVAIVISLFLILFPWKHVLLYPGTLRAHFFDIGQGDSIYLRMPGGEDVLIDGGPDNTILAKLGNAMPFWDRTIEHVILTHPQADHLTGLLAIINKYKIEHFYYTEMKNNIPQYDNLVFSLNKNSIQTIVIDKPTRQQLSFGAWLEFLPPLEHKENKHIDLNNTSLVTRIVWQEHELLFTGDIEKDAEEALLHKGYRIKSDVLKVAHHGSKTSSSPRFLAKVNPAIAVIQAGRNNRFGHPHAEVLQRFSDHGIKLFRTDKDGDITLFFSNGSKETIEISTEE